MTLKINRKQVLAISKIDFTGLGHSQRLDLIAKALGLKNQATLMTLLKAEGERSKSGMREPPSGADTLFSELIATKTFRETLSFGLHLFVSSTELNPESLALRFADKLATSRSTPEVIIVRDEESAKRAVDLSRTGPVFACIHGGDAKAGIDRLHAFGVDTRADPVLMSVSVARRERNPDKVSLRTLPTSPFAFSAETDFVRGGDLDGMRI